MPSPDFTALVNASLEAHLATAAKVQAELAPAIAQSAALVVETLRSGHQIFFFGNGGSAADAQHLAAEFTGRFVRERRALPALALTTDTSALTAIGNDYGFDQIFARQVEALARPGDLLVGISTSGSSPNVLLALELGRAKGCRTLALTGRDGGRAATLAEVCLVVPSDITARIQEMHILVGHVWCEAVDEYFFGN
jgi:D-sedoheptulose 7-phosphate isomerase